MTMEVKVVMRCTYCMKTLEQPYNEFMAELQKSYATAAGEAEAIILKCPTCTPQYPVPRAAE